LGTAGSPESEPRQLGWKICETHRTLTEHSIRIELEKVHAPRAFVQPVV